MPITNRTYEVISAAGEMFGPIGSTHRPKAANRGLKGIPVNSYDDDQLATIGLAVYVAPPAPAPTPEQILANLINEVQRYLDETAQSRGYDGILSLCSYASSTDPIYAAEGQAGMGFRDACWRLGFIIREQVMNGQKPDCVPTAPEGEEQRIIPTAEELIAAMPVIGW